MKHIKYLLILIIISLPVQAFSKNSFIIIGAGVYTHIDPDNNSKRLFIVRFGDIFEKINDNNEWVKIKINKNKKGWVRKKYTKKYFYKNEDIFFDISNLKYQDSLNNIGNLIEINSFLSKIKKTSKRYNLRKKIVNQIVFLTPDSEKNKKYLEWKHTNRKLLTKNSRYKIKKQKIESKPTSNFCVRGALDEMTPGKVDFEHYLDGKLVGVTSKPTDVVCRYLKPGLYQYMVNISRWGPDEIAHNTTIHIKNNGGLYTANCSGGYKREISQLLKGRFYGWFACDDTYK